jgi:hypothetical protein
MSKIIHHTSVNVGEESVLHALCEDGTLWERAGGTDWVEVPPIPQPQTEENRRRPDNTASDGDVLTLLERLYLAGGGDAKPIVSWKGAVAASTAIKRGALVGMTLVCAGARLEAGRIGILWFAGVREGLALDRMEQHNGVVEYVTESHERGH